LSRWSYRRFSSQLRPPLEGISAPGAKPVSAQDRSNDEALARVYERWFNDVRRWVRQLGATEADVDDLVQEVFLVVHRRLADFDGQNLASWLYRITRRRVRDHRRLIWVKRVLRAGDMSSMSHLRYTRSGPDHELDKRENALLLEELLASLKEEQRVALVLFEIEGWRGEDIASFQNVPVNTVWGRIHRARLHLQKSVRRHQR
jgi:RNA polymerase sigma-70 factor (ECF subfamily)